MAFRKKIILLSKLGMIGGGMMGEALLSRLVFENTFDASEILISDPVVDRQNFLADRYGVQVTGNNVQAAEASELLLLAIKPQIFSQVTQQILVSLNPSVVIVSILAGISLPQLEAAFPSHAVIRAMPNTPAQVGAGITAIARGTHVTDNQFNLAKKVLSAVGSVVEVPESMMDAVTGLSGSGPGYIALVVEALADGGVASGLPRTIAMQLAIDTVLGTAKLLKESNLHPGELKDRVTSPGGTTIAGVAMLEERGLRSALIEAVKAATARSKELGS
jgi:pyrroline-5-carboxylate reductase